MKLHLVISFLIIAAVSAEPLPGEQVRLLDSVEVNHTTVLLSDLLPPNTASEIREIGTTIELCRTPQPGSLRILRKDQILAATASQAQLLPTLSIPSVVMIRSRGWPISKKRVRNAVSEFLDRTENRSLPETATVILPEFLAATDANYQLQVTHMQSDFSEREINARVRCVPRMSCGTFLVRVILRDGEQLQLPNTSSSANRNPSADSRPRLVTQGKPATLVLEDNATRISLPVICLQSGLLNQRIHVFDKQSRRIYSAEVIGIQLLRANL